MSRNVGVVNEGDILEASKTTFLRAANYGEIISSEETPEGIVFMFIPRLKWDGHDYGVGIWRPELTHKLHKSHASAMHLRYFAKITGAQKAFNGYLKGDLPPEHRPHKERE